MKKLLVVGVIVLFLGLAVAPSINANINRKQPKAVLNATDQDIVEIVVTEYKPDGTIEKSTLKMPYIKVKELRKELKDVKDEEERLSIYKKYNLISQNVTCEKLRADMDERARRLGLSKNKIENALSRDETNIPNFLKYLKSVKNYMCLVSGIVAIGIRLYFGVSWFTSFINGVMFYYLNFPSLFIPSADVINTGLVLGGRFETRNGTLPNNGEDFFDIMFYLIVGFVGFVISLYLIPIRRIIFGWEDFFGFAAFAYAIGVRSVDPRP